MPTASMKTETYSLSFTTGTLLHRESMVMAEQFLTLQDWDAVRDAVVSQNLLQSRTLNTSKRLCQEVSSRLRTLGDSEVDLLVQGTLREQSYLLWVGVCRRYQFIADFAREILHEKFISLKTVLTYDDFDAFFNQKAEWHEELERIQPATKGKLRQVLFKMLREAGLLTVDNQITPALLSPRLVQAIAQENVSDILIFPAFESDLRQWAQ
jgi:hypothetical protein